MNMYISYTFGNVATNVAGVLPPLIFFVQVDIVVSQAELHPDWLSPKAHMSGELQIQQPPAAHSRLYTIKCGNISHCDISHLQISNGYLPLVLFLRRFLGLKIDYPPILTKINMTKLSTSCFIFIWWNFSPKSIKKFVAEIKNICKQHKHHKQLWHFVKFNEPKIYYKSNIELECREISY